MNFTEEEAFQQEREKLYKWLLDVMEGKGKLIDAFREIVEKKKDWDSYRIRLKSMSDEEVKTMMRGGRSTELLVSITGIADATLRRYIPTLVDCKILLEERLGRKMYYKYNKEFDKVLDAIAKFLGFKPSETQ